MRDFTRKVGLTLLLHMLLLHHLLRRQVAQCMRVRRTPSHTLPTHPLTRLTRLPRHAQRARGSRMMSARHHAHMTVLLHAHDRGLADVRLSWARDTRVHHRLPHVRTWSRRHAWVAVSGHARVHAARLRLVCGHHLAHDRSLVGMGGMPSAAAAASIEVR